MRKRPKRVPCSSILKILADETRLEVLRQLMQRAMHVGELNRVIRIDQSLLSHHLRVLREANLVTSERDGKAVLYRLAPHVTRTETPNAINLSCCELSFR